MQDIADDDADDDDFGAVEVTSALERRKDETRCGGGREAGRCLEKLMPAADKPGF